MQQPNVTPQLNLWRDFISSFTLSTGIRLLYEHLSIVIGSDLVVWDKEKRSHFVDVTNVMTLAMMAMYHLYQPLCDANAAGAPLKEGPEGLKEHCRNLQGLNQAFGQEELGELLDEYIHLFMEGFENYSEQSKLFIEDSKHNILYHTVEQQEVLFTVKQFCNMFRAVIQIDLALLPQD